MGFPCPVIRQVSAYWIEHRTLGTDYRNGRLVAAADVVLLFADGRDADVFDLLGRAVKLGKPVRVARVAFAAAGKAVRGWG